MCNSLMFFDDMYCIYEHISLKKLFVFVHTLYTIAIYIKHPCSRCVLEFPIWWSIPVVIAWDQQILK